MTTHDTAPGAIVLSGLSKSYGEVGAVKSIDLAIAPGETVALLGPNGAGKTTTIDMMLGLTRPDSGTVSLFGMSATEAAAAGVVGGMLQT
ncbi:MAG: ATP-binding cassette domain-containing protein, partial [Solirubrobacteraceae bacterium]